MMLKTRITSTLVVLATIICSGLSAQKKPEPTALFNGKDLDNWYVVARDIGVVDTYEYFSVEDGIIHVYKDQVHGTRQPYAGLITKESYSRYHLSLEYKWGKKKFIPRHDFVRDAGVMYHLFGDEIIWPNCLEMQIQEGDTGDLWIIGARASTKVSNVIRNYAPNGDIQTLGGDQRFNRFHRGYCWEVPGWNHIELIVDGANAIFKVNGRVVNEVINAEYPDPETGEWKPLTEGKILLQAEGAELFYRNVLLTPLPEEE